MYELVDGASVRFGSVEAVYRKLSSFDESIMKTPAAPRCNQIIASTPDSLLVRYKNAFPIFLSYELWCYLYFPLFQYRTLLFLYIFIE